MQLSSLSLVVQKTFTDLQLNGFKHLLPLSFPNENSPYRKEMKATVDLTYTSLYTIQNGVGGISPATRDEECTLRFKSSRTTKNVSQNNNETD